MNIIPEDADTNPLSDTQSILKEIRSLSEKFYGLESLIAEFRVEMKTELRRIRTDLNLLNENIWNERRERAYLAERVEELEKHTN